MTACWICGSTRTALEKSRNLADPIDASDLRITDARYGTTLALARCDDCGFVFADDPELERLDELYAELDDPDYEDGDENRALQMRWLLELCLAQHPRAQSLLDVGAANGLLVTEATRRGLSAVGIEPSAALGRTARARGADVLTGTLPHPELEGRTFDLVTLVDVIEHVKDPLGLCRAAARHLSPRGRLVVVTPDVSSLPARLLGPRWWHFRVAHVGYFSARSMARAAERSGLAVERTVRARWFFPARYLAERTGGYLPLSRKVVAWLERTHLGRRALDQVIPLNLHDSSVYFLTPVQGRSEKPLP